MSISGKDSSRFPRFLFFNVFRTRPMYLCTTAPLYMDIVESDYTTGSEINSEKYIRLFIKTDQGALLMTSFPEPRTWTLV